MEKSPKKQNDTNVKVFMQTETYAQLNSELQWQLNNNSQVFNLKIPQPSNLIEPSGIGREHVYYKNVAERAACKKAKHEYKLSKLVN